MPSFSTTCLTIASPSSSSVCKNDFWSKFLSQLKFNFRDIIRDNNFGMNIQFLCCIGYSLGKSCRWNAATTPRFFFFFA